MKIYIAGKITGLVYEEALRAFAAAEDELRRLGHEPVNPMRLIAECGMQNAEWKPCMQHLIPILMACDAIYLLENWKESKGARLEKHIAQELGMLIVTHGFEGKRGEIFPVCKDCGNVLDDNAGVFRCGACRRKLENLSTANNANDANEECPYVKGESLPITGEPFTGNPRAGKTSECRRFA